MINNREYYDKLYVKYELVRAMKDREVIFLSRSNPKHCIRGLWIKSVEYLSRSFNTFNFFKKDYNIYISVAKLDYIPPFTFYLKERAEETRAFFKDEYLEYVNSFDMLLDFDASDLKEFGIMVREIQVFLNTLDSFKVCYYIVPSGNNFQVIIPDCFDNVKTFGEKEDSYNNIVLKYVKRMKKLFKLTTLDTVGVGDLRKIMKCPYSLVGENVVLPLKDFNNFKYDDVKFYNVLTSVHFVKRGLCLYNDAGMEENQKNFKNFIYKNYLDKDYEVKQNGG